jgi:hypothetical protein
VLEEGPSAAGEDAPEPAQEDCKTNKNYSHGSLAIALKKRGTEGGAESTVQAGD